MEEQKTNGLIGRVKPYFNLVESVKNLSRVNHQMRLRCTEAKKDKDQAYMERNILVAFLARQYPSGIRPTAIEGWNVEWQGCVYIDLPDGQVSFHYHDSQAYLFAGLPPYTQPYDGHSKQLALIRILQAAGLQDLTTALKEHS